MYLKYLTSIWEKVRKRMNDKDKIYFNACLYAIDKLVKKGSCRYSWKDNNGKWNSISWNEVLHWILEKLNAESEDTTLDKIRAEIEQVKSIMNEEIINHDRIDLINFVNGLNQSLVIIDKYKAGSED